MAGRSGLHDAPGETGPKLSVGPVPAVLHSLAREPARALMLVRHLSTRAPVRAAVLRRRAASTLTGSVKYLRSCLVPAAAAGSTDSGGGSANGGNSASINSIASTNDEEPQTATVRGWVRSARHQKAVSFLEVVDGSSVQGLQVVLDADRVFGGGAAADTKKALTTGCSVEVSGRVVPHPKQAGVCELHGDSVRVVGECPADEYPLQKKYHTLDFLRQSEVLHLRPRTNTLGAAARVRHHAFQAAHAFLDAQDFIQVHCPVITKSDCEGAGELFSVESAVYLHSLADNNNNINNNNNASNHSGGGGGGGNGNGAEAAEAPKPFFPAGSFEADDHAGMDGRQQQHAARSSSLPHLTVSSQLEAEIYASALSRVYSFGPCFRAENSRTTRHLAEFWMLEPEIAFTDLGGIMDLAEGCVQHTVSRVLDRCADELAFFAKTQGVDAAALERLATTPFARASYTDAVAQLREENARSPGRFAFNDIHWGMDLQSEHERWLAEEVYGGPVFVTDYPATLKPFYMRRNDGGNGGNGGGGNVAGSAPQSDEGETVACMDLLMPRVGEMIGGSMREERHDVLEAAMRAQGMNVGAMQWYLDLRKYGSVPHGGWGLGFDRLLMFMTGLENIRDVVPFPRTANMH